MSSVNGGKLTGKAYWRSLEEFSQTPEFDEFVFNEFPAGAAEMLNSVERRSFLKVMGASMALAGFGLAGCRRWPKEKIAPYARRPEDRVPGVPEHFATCMELGGVSTPLLVTSYDGRPIKIEGLDGGTTAIHQASVLDLYDPDRSRHVLRGGEKSNHAAFDAWAAGHFQQLRANGGGTLAVLAEASDSPSVRAMRQAFEHAYPEARWYEYEPLNNDHEIAGSTLAFGSPHRVHVDYAQADVIIALDSDFLEAHPNAVRNIRDFASRRARLDEDKSLNRLYAFESCFSLTGANADHRAAVRCGDVGIIAAKFAAALLADTRPDVASALREVASRSVASPSDVDGILEQAIADAGRKDGRCVFVAGPRQPAEVHLLVHMMNAAIGSAGSIVTYSPIQNAALHGRAIADLAADIQANNVGTLLVLGGNPAYNAPADLNFTDLLARVENTVHLSHYVDETSRACDWHVPRAHYLESWGDGRAWDGTVSICQPLIEPLFDGRSLIETLSIICGRDQTAGYDIVRGAFANYGPAGDFEISWRQALHDGFVPGTTVTPAAVAISFAGDARQIASRLAAGGGASDGSIEVVFAQDQSVYDGRFANNGWLQEMPDSLGKLTWDNAVLLGPARAEALDVKTGDMVRLGEEGLSAAVLVMPGQHPDSATVTLGYGRRDIGAVADGAGFNFYKLRTSEAMGARSGVTIEPLDRSYDLAQTQHHYAIGSVAEKGTQKRLPNLYREGTLDEFRKRADFAHHGDHAPHVAHRLSLFPEDQPFHNLGENDENAYAWAMSIDLNTCVGCNACVVACQAENNIPIVGKDQVMRGREMHWMRLDRYWRGSDPATPEAVAMMPLTCQHCENAPCEQVCPVAATVHDSDGLNVMVYNRCIGTRYCSNNCPYKVRRFNYFDFHRREPVRDGGVLHVKGSYYTKSQAAAHPLRQLQFNPEVTIRVRGVMEKCTFCVQRLTTARIRAKNEWVRQGGTKTGHVRPPIADEEVIPACAQACPARAITFGDAKNPDSTVASHMNRDLGHGGHARAYDLLEENHTRPRNRFLARVRNPAPGLEHEPPSSDSGH